MIAFSLVFTSGEVPAGPTISIDGTAYVIDVSAAATPTERALDYASKISALANHGAQIASVANNGVIYVAALGTTSMNVTSGVFSRQADTAIANYVAPAVDQTAAKASGAMAGVILGVLVAKL